MNTATGYSSFNTKVLGSPELSKTRFYRFVNVKDTQQVKCGACRFILSQFG